MRRPRRRQRHMRRRGKHHALRMTSAIVPAAGSSSRMGRPKLLLPYRDTTVAGALLDSSARGRRRAHRAGGGRDGDAALRALGARRRASPSPSTSEPERGMLSSILAGLDDARAAPRRSRRSGQPLLVTPRRSARDRRRHHPRAGRRARAQRRAARGSVLSRQARPSARDRGRASRATSRRSTPRSGCASSSIATRCWSWRSTIRRWWPTSTRPRSTSRCARAPIRLLADRASHLERQSMAPR